MIYNKREIDLFFKTELTPSHFQEMKIRLEVLKSLDLTIDVLFEELLREGREKELDLLCPYFGVLWPSAIVLTNELASQNLELKRGPSRILEVGCGLALPSLFLMNTLHTSKIACSDFHPEVGPFLKRNLLLNPPSKIQLEYIPSRFSDLSLSKRKWDVIIGSDILYESSHPEELAEALNTITHPNGEIMITDPGRPYLQKFSDEMRLRGWFADPKIVKVEKNETIEMDSPFKEVYYFNFKKDKRNSYESIFRN